MLGLLIHRFLILLAFVILSIEICLAQPLIWNCSTSSDNIFPNIPIDNSFIADSIRDSPYLSSAYIYRFQPDINDSCNGKTLVEFCFDNTESVTNIVMDILLGKIDRINSANTFISAIVLARININAIVTCNRELTDNNAVCCHSEQINISLPTQMNGFAVVFPNQALLEYNDSQYQVETFVTTAIDFIRINSNDQPILEVTGYTTNLTLRFLRFVIEKNETTTKALPDVNPIMINIIAATVSPIVIVLTIILVTLTIVVLVIMQRKRGKKAVTEREGFDNANAYGNPTVQQQPLESHMHPWTTNDEAPLTQQVNAVQTDTENDAYTARIVTKSNKAYVASIVTENNVAYCNKAGSEYTTIIDSLPEDFDKFDRNNHQTHVEEGAYVVPASDEHSLYNQFSKIKIQTLNKHNIRTTNLLGSGQFGTVHKGEWMASEGGEKIEVAVKTLKEGAGEQDKIKFLQEAAIMGQFSHPNVVKLYGVVTEGEPIMLILELLPKGDLCRVLQSTNSVDADLPHTLLSYCRRLASGMSYLSNKLFVHRDLAARNILVSEDGACKIADFGMSRDLADESYYISHGGKIPVKWTAPEAIHYNKYSTASDVWSFGCVMYEIWSLGHAPFEEHTNTECIMIIYDKGMRLAPPPGCPRVVYKLMMDCWHPDPSSRPDFASMQQQLSLPDTKLLKWSEEDKASDPEAATLGAGLDKAVNLYMDLWKQYINVP